MDRYGYVINRNGTEEQQDGRYHKTELELMTTFQLREICRKERIIQGVMDPMDKDDLIRVILRFRGADEFFLIRQADKKGLEALNQVFQNARINYRQDLPVRCSSKIVVYAGLAVGFYDRLTIPYVRELAGTNAFVIGGDGRVCAVLNIEQRGELTDCLYLTMSAGLPCQESGIKNYSLYCLKKRGSEQLYRIYSGNYEYMPEQLEVYRIPLLDFEVRKPVVLDMPLAIDFGTTNTTAGVYLDSLYFEKTGMKPDSMGLKENDVNYAMFYDISSGWQESTLLPSVVGVLSVEAGKPKFLFGYEAVRLADLSYIDEGFCVFYDIKRWIGDYEKAEEITDRQGRRGAVKRKEILKAYFNCVIAEAENRFKCKVESVHISSPVKQKRLFQKLFGEILPGYAVEKEEMIDEGVSVLYNTISEMIRNKTAEPGREYEALVIDCGGGTTDLSSCRFSIWDKRVSYQIQIETAYENGDTDFGGNNLTYRLMQALKIELVNRLNDNRLKSFGTIVKGFDIDVFRFVDQNGADRLYLDLEEEYRKAEAFLPTRFKDFEQKSHGDYYKVKNNFYFLFRMAEMIKKEFYNRIGTLRVALGSEPVRESATTWLAVDKWKISVSRGERLETVKEFPQIYFSIFELELLLKGDIYEIIHKFIGPMYEDNSLEEYSIIKLTGQSCKIDLFRGALKEFVPGKIIQFKRRSGDLTEDYELKMTCIDGALRYLRDKRYGFADIKVQNNVPALPYQITAFTHNGEEVLLLDGLDRDGESGMISRNMENLTLKLYLKDSEGRNRYQFTCYCTLKDFRENSYEEIRTIYGHHIRQSDTDDIIDREVKFFVWARPMDWSFLVVPVYRKDERLYLGKEEEFCFENDSWVQNFFDGLK